jgi:hypothetical protein
MICALQKAAANTGEQKKSKIRDNNGNEQRRGH